MIDFSYARWDRLREDYGAWWKGTLGRPLIDFTLRDDTPYGGSVPLLSQSTCADFSVTPDAIIERMDFELSHCTYLGDAFPRINLDSFGPGVLAALLGARLDNGSGGVWFFPEREAPIDELHFALQLNGQWLERILMLYAAGHRRWGGMVRMGMPDLGGVLDVLASFRGTEDLLMDLYDQPEEVKRACAEIQLAWQQAYKLFADENRCPELGYTDWCGLYSPTPSYVIQCDFSYMIGPEMFGEFVLPTLKADADFLSNSIYHLDGKGELPHLPELLQIDGLDAVQWVPGDGAPPPEEWMDVYRQIAAASKGIQVVGSTEGFEKVLEGLDTWRLYHGAWFWDGRQAEYWLERFGLK